MNKYYCDICNEELNRQYSRPNLIEKDSIEDICKIKDVCAACKHIGSKIDIKKVLTEEWKSRVFPQHPQQER